MHYTISINLKMQQGNLLFNINAQMKFNVRYLITLMILIHGLIRVIFMVKCQYMDTKILQFELI
ncbi:unnamed protein product [Paramecium octaurelia]|uniref:Transmembrane protein n=1 Tax=Paramecium octaurelia TaxID=43137 RepID=A0A8S1SMU8_PAROT|nr:unnamed protein product [Paramecium octaurelia]